MGLFVFRGQYKCSLTKASCGLVNSEFWISDYHCYYRVRECALIHNWFARRTRYNVTFLYYLFHTLHSLIKATWKWGEGCGVSLRRLFSYIERHSALCLVSILFSYKYHVYFTYILLPKFCACLYHT